MRKIIAFVLVAVCFINSFSVCAVENLAQSAIVINARTRHVIYSKNANQKRAMASTTKIMTALLLAEQNTPDKTVTVTWEMAAVEGSSMGLKVGDTVAYNDLLYGILLPSGNDAANTAAIAISGSIEKFADLMNARAKELGLTNTHFVTPSGLDADTHYTTALDLAVLASYALENENFRKAVSTKSITLNIGEKKIHLSNHNKLLKTYDGAFGVKTGYTSKAGRCLVSAAKRDNTEIIAVTLNDRNDWQDHANLLDYGFANSKDFAYVPEIPKSLKIIGGDKNNIKIISTALGIGVSGNEKFEYITHLPPFLYAPVNEGDVVGYTEVLCGKYKVATLPIYADSKVLKAHENYSFLKRIYKTFLVLLRGL